eukprot:TRINITY_DN22778_c0_g1_i1.p1 TRINITY_DN22778_c0_g1~~TRINITY_DN22778_c0_g1_i1.p1  ORF type:complete len:612 (+),score=64.12 TRINITY_DN22778_c0_g1_i1:58-1893(+)
MQRDATSHAFSRLPPARAAQSAGRRIKVSDVGMLAHPRPLRLGGRFWLVLNDPCGLVCTFCTYIVACGAAALTNMGVLLPSVNSWGSFAHVIAYNYNIIALILSHVRCMCTSPGTARTHLDKELVDAMREEFARLRAGEGPRGNEPVSSNRKWWCTKCDTFRPKHTHHCSTCGCCVLEMDHHCPWVNNCVGWRNHKFFLLFLFHACIGCLWSAIVLLYALGHPPRRLSSGRHLEDRVSAKHIDKQSLPWFRSFAPHPMMLYNDVWLQLFCAMVCVICFMLFIFACVMCFDQWEYMARGYGVIGKKQIELSARRQQKSSSKENANPHDGRVQLSPGEAAGAGLSAGSLSKPSSGIDDVASVGRSSSWGCKKLPFIMGHAPVWQWLLPVGPGDRMLAEPPQDAFVTAVLERHRSRGSSSQERDAILEQRQCGDVREADVVGGADVNASEAHGKAPSSSFREASDARVGDQSSPTDSRSPQLATTVRTLESQGLRGRRAALAALASEDNTANSRLQSDSDYVTVTKFAGVERVQGLGARNTAPSRTLVDSDLVVEGGSRSGIRRGNLSESCEYDPQWPPPRGAQALREAAEVLQPSWWEEGSNSSFSSRSDMSG